MRLGLLLGILACAANAGLAAPPSTQPAPPMPEASFEDLALLVKTARRALHDTALGLPPREARYLPPAMANVNGIIHLTLRRDGAIQAEAESKEIHVMQAAAAAGALLGRAVINKKIKCPEGGDGLGLEFEWLGPREYFDPVFGERGVWSDELLHAFEPAAEGIGVEFRGRRGWTRPSQIISLSYTPDVALATAEAAIGLKTIDKNQSTKDIKYFRFRAVHLWQPSAGALPVVLVRGESLVAPEAVTAEGLDGAIRRIGSYVRYRQNRDGWFAEEYLPARDRYSDSNSARMQMHALYGLATYAAWAGGADLVAAVDRGIAQNAQFLKPFMVPDALTTTRAASSTATTTSAPQGEGTHSAGLVLAFPGHEDYLEISARLLSGLTEQSRAAKRAGSSWRWEEQRRGLIDGLLAAQDSDGRLEMVFKERKESEQEKDAAAGWALLALAQAIEPEGKPRLGDCLGHARKYYAKRLQESPSARAAAALGRALSLGYVHTNDANDSDFVFSVLDRFSALQVNSTNCPWPELWGAINAGRLGELGADTATYLSALSEGVALAERVGDMDRARKYRAAALGAARFVMQLEVRDAGCYYIRNRKDALGGIRAAVWSNRIVADDCAEALIALIRARELLFGSTKSSAGSAP